MDNTIPQYNQNVKKQQPYFAARKGDKREKTFREKELSLQKVNSDAVLLNLKAEYNPEGVSEKLAAHRLILQLMVRHAIVYQLRVAALEFLY
jgi:hypothetical protein